MKKIPQIFNEKEALKNVKKDSSFSKYYESERGKIKRQIIWKRDPTLPQATRGQTIVEANCETTLRFHALPAPPSLAHLAVVCTI